MRGQGGRVFVVFIFKCASVGIKPLLKSVTRQPRVCAGVVVGVHHRGLVNNTRHKTLAIKGAGPHHARTIAARLCGFFPTFQNLDIVPGYCFFRSASSSRDRSCEKKYKGKVWK